MCSFCSITNTFMSALLPTRSSWSISVLVGHTQTWDLVGDWLLLSKSNYGIYMHCTILTCTSWGNEGFIFISSCFKHTGSCGKRFKCVNWWVVTCPQDDYTDCLLLFLYEVLQSRILLVWVRFKIYKTLTIANLNCTCKQCTDLILCCSFPSLLLFVQMKAGGCIPCCCDSTSWSSVISGSLMHV